MATKLPSFALTFRLRKSTIKHIRSAPMAVLLMFAALVAMTGSISFASETWTDSTGKYQVVGDFLALRDDVVYLRKENGVTIAVPLERLNEASQQLARRLAIAPIAESSPDAEIRLLLDRLQSGDFRALWDSLPESYQADVNEIVQTFGQNMDTEVWNAGRRVLGKLMKVLQGKKDWILGYPALQQTGMDMAVVDKNWDGAVGLLVAIYQSDLTDLEKLKAFDGAAFMEGSGKAIIDQIMLLAKAMEENVDPDRLAIPMEFPGLETPSLDFANVQISTVSRDGDTAVLRFTRPTGETEDEEAVRVEGKWLPKEMVDQWAEGVESSKQFLTMVMPGQLKEAKPMLLSPLSPVRMVEGVLDQLLAAEDQAAFNEVIDGMMEMAGGMMGAGDEGGVMPFEEPPADDDAAFDDPFGNDP
jgi:hypothetical protein